MQPPTTAIRGSQNGAGNLLQLSAGFPLDGRCEVRSLRIVVANHDPAMMQFYREVLARLGHQVCVALTGRQVVDQCRLLRPDLAIIEVNVPVLDGIAAAYEICRDKPTPIILVSGNHDTDLLRRALDNPYVLAWLFKPLKDADIGPAIVVAMSRFEQFESLRQEAADLRHVLKDRRLIERAKSIVMKYARLDEQEAYRRLQKLASVQNRKLVEVARAILTAGEVFDQMEQPARDYKSSDGRGRNTDKEPRIVMPGTSPDGKRFSPCQATVSQHAQGSA